MYPQAHVFQPCLTHKILMHLRCDRCTALAPEFAAASTELKGEVLLASVDCTSEEALCKKYRVQGVPDLKVFRADAGGAWSYNGGLVTEAIVKYMRKQKGLSYLVLSSHEELDAFLTNEVAITAYVTNIESNGKLPSFYINTVEISIDSEHFHPAVSFSKVRLTSLNESLNSYYFI